MLTRSCATVSELGSFEVFSTYPKLQEIDPRFPLLVAEAWLYWPGAMIEHKESLEHKEPEDHLGVGVDALSVFEG